MALFHRESIEEIGLKNTRQVLLGGAGNKDQKSGHMAQGIDIKIGNLEMHGQTLIIMNDSRDASPWQVDGVIGRSIFESYLTKIDYENSTISLYDPSDAQIKKPPADAIPINLDLNGIPTIEARVNISGKEEKVLKLVLDLGHRNALFLNINKAKGIVMPERTIAAIAGRGIQGEVPSKIGRIHEIQLGNYTLRHVPTSFLEEGANMGLNRELVDGDLGQLILHKFHVIWDYKNRRMILTPNRYFNHSIEFDMAGFGFLEQDREGDWIIHHVIESSPASENDIRKGDKIVKINGKNVREYDFYQVHDLLRQDGKRIGLTIERGKERMEKTLTLRLLI